LFICSPAVLLGIVDFSRVIASKRSMTSIYDLMNFTGGACSLKRSYSICDPTPTYADERAVMIASGN
jgi:hypothetical protein